MNDDHGPKPFPEGVIPFRPRGASSAGSGRANPIGLVPVQRRARFVYDIKPVPGGFAVTFDDTVITRHADRDAALANGRLIASNMWSNGVPSAVRVVEDDGSIRPILSFG